MPDIVLSFPDVKQVPGDRPAQCPHCGTAVLQGWGYLPKPVRDQFLREVAVRRYCCVECGQTFRHYPDGVTRADQTTRISKLAAILWAFGMSYRQAAAVMCAFGVQLSRSSIWRDVQALGEAVRRRRRERPVRILGVDGAWLRAQGEKRGVVVAVDLGTGEPVALEVVEEHDVEAVCAWLSELVEALGVEVMVTDDLGSYRQLASDLGVDHQVCRFHMRRWVGRTLRSLRKKLGKDKIPLLDQVGQIVADMPADGDRQLFDLWRQTPARPPQAGTQATALYQLRRLLIRLSENWHRYRLYAERSDVPATNNGTERAIGKLKVRSTSVRGYKSEAGIQAAFQLCGGTVR
jgi:transposase